MTITTNPPRSRAPRRDKAIARFRRNAFAAALNRLETVNLVLFNLAQEEIKRRTITKS